MLRYCLDIYNIKAVSDFCSIAASLATAISLPLALASFIRTNRAQRLGHMHKLFGDYLRLKFDFEIQGGSSEIAGKELVSFKLYSLEEMWLWTEKERRTFSYKFRINNYRSSIDAWVKTIEFHIVKEPQLTLNSINEFPDAFTKDFKSKVCRTCTKEIKRIADSKITSNVE